MVPGDLLETVLLHLPLNPTSIKFVRDVYDEVLHEIRNLQNCVNSSENSVDHGTTASAPSLREIEDVAENLRKVIDFFNTADTEREQFLRIFPEWELQRRDNIHHLRDIAASIQKSRKLCSAAQIVGGSVGVVGGAALIGALLFPLALPVVLPLWLGGAASSLAIGGGIAAGTGGAAQVATSITEATLLHKRIKQAKEICQQDADSFNNMVGWFRRTQELETVLGNLFGMDILDIIFKDLKVFCGLEDFGSSKFHSTLKTCVGKIFKPHSDYFGLRQDLTLQAAVTAVVFVVFLVQRRNRCLFNCVVLTHRLGFGLMAGLDANVQFGRFVASTFLRNKAVGEVIPKALARRVAVGTLTGIGMALDAANVVLNSIDLAKGSKSDEQAKISDAAEKLQEDLDLVKDVYMQFRYNS